MKVSTQLKRGRAKRQRGMKSLRTRAKHFEVQPLVQAPYGAAWSPCLLNQATADLGVFKTWCHHRGTRALGAYEHPHLAQIQLGLADVRPILMSKSSDGPSQKADHSSEDTRPLGLTMFPSFYEQIERERDKLGMTRKALLTHALDEFVQWRDLDPQGELWRPYAMPNPTDAKKFHVTQDTRPYHLIEDLAASYGIPIRTMAYAIFKWWLKQQGQLLSHHTTSHMNVTTLDRGELHFIKLLVEQRHFSTIANFAGDALNTWRTYREEHDDLLEPFDYLATPTKDEDGELFRVSISRFHHLIIAQYSERDGLKRSDIFYNALVYFIDQWKVKVPTLWIAAQTPT